LTISVLFYAIWIRFLYQLNVSLLLSSSLGMRWVERRNNTNEEGEERQEKRGLDANNDNSSVMEAKLHPACCLFFLNQLMLPFLGTEDMRDALQQP
jgi:hypothetical protein